MYKKEIEELKINNLYRSLQIVKAENPFAYVNGKRALLLCSNDYLGLSRDARVINAMKDYLLQASQCSSRLIAGNDPLLVELEDAIARHKGFEKVLLYPTGYMANLAISSLADSESLILSDELNHASIIDACRLSKARVKIFKHNDLDDLKAKLDDRKRNIIITEGVFSMDGDFGRLREISEIAKGYDSIIILDDAHGDFIYGKNFKGTQEELYANVDIIISSLSKALGSFGGYIASSNDIIEYLINKSRSFIYTSALPAHIAAGALEALKIVREGHRQRDLLNVSKILRGGLLDMGFDVRSSTHIIPIIVGDEAKALRLSRVLLENGIFVQAIRYPTVAKNNARLRVSLTALHLEHVDTILNTFKMLLPQL